MDLINSYEEILCLIVEADLSVRLYIYVSKFFLSEWVVVRGGGFGGKLELI